MAKKIMLYLTDERLAVLGDRPQEMIYQLIDAFSAGGGELAKEEQKPQQPAARPGNGKTGKWTCTSSEHKAGPVNNWGPFCKCGAVRP